MSRVADASHLVRLLTDGQINGLDSLTNLITDGGAVAEEFIYGHKACRVAGADVDVPSLGEPYSLWQYEGTPIGHGAAPGAFANPTRATVGALGQVDPTGGRKKFLTGWQAGGPGQHVLILCDRLAHMSGMDGTVTTAQNVNGGSSGDVTRYADGVGNWLCLEIYTTVGVTRTTVTASYKDGADAAKVTQPVSFGGTSQATRNSEQTLIPLSLAAGGSTVKGCTSITLAATTGTAGDFGVTILHPIAAISVGVGSSCGLFSFVNGHIPEIKTGACLQLIAIAGANASSSVDSVFRFVEV